MLRRYEVMKRRGKKGIEMKNRDNERSSHLNERCNEDIIFKKIENRINTIKNI